MRKIATAKLIEEAKGFDDLLAGKLVADILATAEKLDRFGEHCWAEVAYAKELADEGALIELAHLRDDLAGKLTKARRARWAIDLSLSEETQTFLVMLVVFGGTGLFFWSVMAKQ